MLDCCMGVGSTGVAALSLQQRFIGFEPDPEAFSVAKDQLETFVSQQGRVAHFGCAMMCCIVALILTSCFDHCLIGIPLEAENESCLHQK